MASQSLTPLQVNFLKLFSVDHSDEFVLELKKVYDDYLQKKIDVELDRLWDEGIINQEKLDQWRYEDVHELLRKNGKACS